MSAPDATVNGTSPVPLPRVSVPAETFRLPLASLLVSVPPPPSVPPALTDTVLPFESVTVFDGSMVSVQPLQPRFSPMIGLGMTLSTMSSVGDAFVSAALSPGAQPGKPPVGDHTPAVLVQFPIGGGALPVTL